MIKDINEFFCPSEHEDVLNFDEVKDKPKEKPVCTISPSGVMPEGFSLKGKLSVPAVLFGNIEPYIHIIKKGNRVYV